MFEKKAVLTKKKKNMFGKKYFLKIVFSITVLFNSFSDK